MSPPDTLTVNPATPSTLTALLGPALETGGTKRRSSERNRRERLQAARSCLALSRRHWRRGEEDLDADGLPLQPPEHRRQETVFLELFEQILTAPADTLSERTLLNWHATLCGVDLLPALVGYRTSDTTFGDRAGSPHEALTEEMQTLLREVWVEAKEIDAQLKNAWAQTAGIGDRETMLPGIVALSVHLQAELCRMNPFWSHTTLISHLAGAWIFAHYSWPAPIFTDVEAYVQASEVYVMDERRGPLLRLTARSIPG